MYGHLVPGPFAGKRKCHAIRSLNTTTQVYAYGYEPDLPVWRTFTRLREIGIWEDFASFVYALVFLVKIYKH